MTGIRNSLVLPIRHRPWREQLRLALPPLLFATAMQVALFLIISSYVAFGANLWQTTPDGERTRSLQALDAFVALKTGAVPARGELVAFHPGVNRYFPPNAVFVKRVLGLPGDHIRFDSGTFLINGTPVSVAKSAAFDGAPLTPGPTGVLPECRYFLGTGHPHGFDSRYGEIGWVRCEQIIGPAYAVSGLIGLAAVFLLTFCSFSLFVALWVVLRKLSLPRFNAATVNARNTFAVFMHKEKDVS